MKSTNILHLLSNLSLYTACLFLFTTCGGDDEAPSEPLLGTYQFTLATFTQAASFTNNGTPLNFAVGGNASDFVSEPLLAEAPCTGPANARLEFRSDGKTYLTCVNETTPAEEQGTWTINPARTILTLTVPTTASPTGNFSIAIENLSITSTSISGTINSLPAPIEITNPIGQGNIQFIKVNVTFTKVP
jgi:hypothetical protein